MCGRGATRVLTLLISIGLATTLGFAANRASLCTVRGVAEVASTGRAAILRSTLKSVAWVLALTLPIAWLVPDLGRVRVGWALSGLTLAGGLLYGAGAAVNGACAFSTLNLLAGGRLRMMMTLIGLGGGAMLGLFGAHAGRLELPRPVALPVDRLFPWALVVSGALALWGVFELRRLWRTRPAGIGFSGLVTSPRYRLSTAAALIGLSNGVLYLLQGAWSYTSTLEHVVRLAFNQTDPALPAHGLLFLAMLAGMTASAWQRGDLRLDWRPSLGWLRHLAGGLLMGLGALLVPGGNDSLVLYGIPSLSPHAAPAYAAMLAGVFITLTGMRRLLAMDMRVDCAGDVCVIDEPDGSPRGPSSRPVTPD